jgi:hypothetical protein
MNSEQTNAFVNINKKASDETEEQRTNSVETKENNTHTHTHTLT